MKRVKRVLIVCCGVIPMLLIATGSISSELNQVRNTSGVTANPEVIRTHGFGPAMKKTVHEGHTPLSEMIEQELESEKRENSDTGPYLPLGHQVFKQGTYFVQYYYK